LREHRVTLVLLALVVLGGSWFPIDQSQGCCDRYQYPGDHSARPATAVRHYWSRMQGTPRHRGVGVTVLVVAKDSSAAKHAAGR
jgi:hypothetical protein